MNKRTKAFFSIVLALLLMLVTFTSSSMPYQDQSATSLIQTLFPSQPFYEVLSSIRFDYAGQTISIPSLGYAQFIEFFIRKAAHFFIYFFIAFNWNRGLRVYMKHTGLALVVAFLITVLYAASDEFHQSLTPNRTPLLADVFLDSLGAAFGILISYIKPLR